MAREVDAIKDKDIQHLQKGKKRAEGTIKGLMIERLPSGELWWRMKYFGPTKNRPEGAWTMRSLGRYPEVTLLEAKSKGMEILVSVNRGANVDAILRPTKREIEAKEKKETEEQGVIFQTVFDKWVSEKTGPAIAKNTQNKTVMGEETLEKTVKRFEKYILPKWHDKPIKTITKDDAIELLKEIYKNTQDGSHRIFRKLKHIWIFAEEKGYIEKDVIKYINISEQIGSVEEKNLSAITDKKELAVLLQSLKEWSGPVVRIGLQLSAHLFLRSSELRNGKWSEVDFENRKWIIPAKRMKIHKNGYHYIHLTEPVIKLLEELKYYEKSDLMFPQPANHFKALSQNSLTNALYNLGYKDKHTQHGFRATFNTIGREELGFSFEAVELQLHHTLKNPMGKAYDRATFLEARKIMLDKWSEFLENLQK